MHLIYVTIQMMETIRAFIAIELSEKLKCALSQVQAELKRAIDTHHIRWVTPDQMHLTLKFLGDVPTTHVAEFVDRLTQASESILPFTLTAQGLGCFPSARRPNVIWVGLTNDTTLLTQFSKQIDDAYAARGIPREGRPFSPHLTLGRIKREVRPADRAEIGLIIEKFPPHEYGQVYADAVHFIQSELRPSGPIYTILKTVTLH